LLVCSPASTVDQSCQADASVGAALEGAAQHLFLRVGFEIVGLTDVRPIGSSKPVCLRLEALQNKFWTPRLVESVADISMADYFRDGRFTGCVIGVVMTGRGLSEFRYYVMLRNAANNQFRRATTTRRLTSLFL
jgi:hypothetical protein